jgi:hypothetical protein
MVDLTPDAMPPVLKGLWQAANDAETHHERSAPADWRSSTALNVVRVYGLLVRVCSAIVLRDTEYCTSGSNAGLPCDELTAECVRLLGSFARVAKYGPRLTADDRRVAKALDSAKHLTSRVSSFISGCGEGAVLGPEWLKPVPPSFRELLASMAAPTTPDERKRVLALVLNRPDSNAATVLDESNVGLASAVHLALTFDSLVTPRTPVNDDRAYLQAALVRVLISHRVLLEAIGIGEQLTFLSMLGLAELIANTTQLTEDYTTATNEAASSSYTRHATLAVLKDSGRIQVKSRSPEWRRKVSNQEALVVDALDAVIHSSA